MKNLYFAPATSTFSHNVFYLLTPENWKQQLAQNMIHFLSRDLSSSSTRENAPRFAGPIELDQPHHRTASTTLQVYSRCLRWSRVCHDVIRGDVAEEKETEEKEDVVAAPSDNFPRIVTTSSRAPAWEMISQHRIKPAEMLAKCQYFRLKKEK